MLTFFGPTTTCASMSGIVRHNPTPTPSRIWNPIHWPAGEFSSRRINVPEPTAAMMGPMRRNGMKMPVSVMVVPVTIRVIAIQIGQN
jgi:hypothetical protein